MSSCKKLGRFIPYHSLQSGLLLPTLMTLIMKCHGKEIRYIIFSNAWKKHRDSARPSISCRTNSLKHVRFLPAAQLEASGMWRPTASLWHLGRSGYLGKSVTSLVRPLNNSFIISVGIFFYRESYLDHITLQNIVIWYLMRLGSFNSSIEHNLKNLTPI